MPRRCNPLGEVYEYLALVLVSAPATNLGRVFSLDFVIIIIKMDLTIPIIAS